MKSIVIYSGGLDSTVLLADLLDQGHEVKALSVNYGQRHKRELEHAALICAKLKVEHQIADLSNIARFLGGSSQTDASVPVPHGHYEEEAMKLTVVPNRNAIMLSVAAAWAISLKYNAVAYAAHAGDHAVYPDCRSEFVEPFAQAIWNADWHHVAIERPFLKLSKADIVARGAKLGAPMELSYSCYEGGEVHCGLCGTDIERRLAFIEAGVQDPTTYANPLPERYVHAA